MSSKKLITIDPTSKIILEYAEKVRGTSKRKRVKLNEKVLAVRPSDFPGIDVQKLCDILIRFAYNGNFIDEVFREHILGLVVDESLSWNVVLRSVITTKIDNLFMKCQLCELVREMVHLVQIKSFDDRGHIDALISIVKPTFFFVTQLILDVLSDEENMELMQLEFETSRKPYEKPLEALDALIHDDLCGTLLAIYNAAEVTESLQDCSTAFSKLNDPDKIAISLLDLLLEQHQKTCQPPEFEYIPEGLALFDFKNPSIRILVPIFACFKNHETSELIASTIQTFAEIMRVSPDDVVFDLIHAAILLKCEESMDLLHLPKQHRVDFRWQSTVFFYKKLPQIIGFLIKSGGMRVEDVAKGLERAVKDLTMMLDASDAAWQNASFLTFLNDLQPFLGKQTTDSLRNQRREHMKSMPHLTALAESEDAVTDDTDIARLMNAVKLVDQKTNALSESILEKVQQGLVDDFDALVAVLTTEGRLMQTGKEFVARNMKAQKSGNIGEFDDTFLMLSRILIQNPSLSIRMLVNGGPGRSDAESSIFYNWSMWYVKRVAKHNKPEAKDEEELENLRKEVSKLRAAANKSVGIDEEIEEEEEKEERVKAEEIKKEEKPEESAENEEKMDTSEKIPDVFNEEKKVEEEPQKEVKVEEPKKLNNTITWLEMNCPLPRISKRTARTYLARLKEGQPFWKSDGMDIGAILAAIPVVGQLLLEDHDEKRHRIDRKAVEEAMVNIMLAFQPMPSLVMCLVEWMDCEPDSPSRTSLAISTQAALDKTVGNTGCRKWEFLHATLRQIILELIDKSPTFPEVTCTAFSTARRFCPFVARNEKPDQVKLKHAWYYMRQQGWASPHALRLLEHANIAGEYNAWSHIYINKTIKSGCGDIMKTSVDMIFSFLMLDDLNSIIRMHESLMDFWLSEDAGQCQVDGRFDPLSMRAVIRLMTQVMLIAEWTLDRLVNEGPIDQSVKLNEPIEAPELEDPHRREKWIFLLKSMLERTVNRFFKILRKGLLSTVVNTIIQLVKSIAGSPESRTKRLLIARIPPDLIFQLAYIEPTAVDYPLINVYCDANNEEHTRTKIMFLCALRRARVF